MSKRARTHTQVDVYKAAMDTAMKVFELSRTFPAEERYSLTDQMRRSARSVCANFAEAWRKRRYPAAFVSKTSDAEAEAAETQTWIEFAVRCGYVDRQLARDLYRRYDRIIATFVGMINHLDTWILPPPPSLTKRDRKRVN